MPETSILSQTDSHVPVVEVPQRETAPEIEPLREVVKRVELDSRRAPREYLDEVRVVLGGE